MMSFRGDRLVSLALPTAVVWFIDEIAEAKGRQALFTRQAPLVLKALRDMAPCRAPSPPIASKA